MNNLARVTTHNTPHLTIRRSVKVIAEQITRNEPELIEQAIREGLKAGAPRSYPYVQLIAHYTDGKPVEAVQATAQAAAVEDEFAYLTSDEILEMLAVLEPFRALARERRQRLNGGLPVLEGEVVVQHEEREREREREREARDREALTQLLAEEAAGSMAAKIVNQ